MYIYICIYVYMYICIYIIYIYITPASCNTASVLCLSTITYWHNKRLRFLLLSNITISLDITDRRRPTFGVVLPDRKPSSPDAVRHCVQDETKHRPSMMNIGKYIYCCRSARVGHELRGPMSWCCSPRSPPRLAPRSQ